jgi:predicted NAD-dependent protein-ADP-ribosyltransferase YbiA (DUF1768 family)
MACQYWYNDAWRSEEEFKQILNNGLLDTLIKDKKVKIPGLKANAKKVKEFAKAGIKKQPIQLRILSKIQSRINNDREAGTLAFVNANPVEILKKANAERKARNPKAKDIPFTIVIKVAGIIKVGRPTKTNEKIRKELLASSVNIEKNLKEGIPYMLVPSAYGLYPIQMKSHAIKDTIAFPLLQNAVKALAKSELGDFQSNRRNIEKLLYQTTVDMKDGKFVVTRIDPKTKKAIPSTFSTAEETSAYLGNLLYRCDYEKINSMYLGEDYNSKLAKVGAISTDLFSEDGNFFNSSSFVIEAYQLSEEDKRTLEIVMEKEMPNTEATITFSEAVAANKTAAPKSTTNKKDEGPIFNTPINEVNAAMNAVAGQVTKDIELGTGSYSIARVIATIKDGVVSIDSIQMISKVKRKNANDKITASPTTISNTEKQAATKAFFELADIKAVKVKVTPTSTAPATTNWASLVAAATSGGELDTIIDQMDKAGVKPSPDLFMEISVQREVLPKATPTSTAGSVIKNALKQMADLAATEKMEEAPAAEELDTLSDMIANSKVIIAEDPIATTEEAPEEDFGDMFDDEVGLIGKSLEDDPNADKVAFRLTPKVDGTKWNRQEELNKLKEIIGNKNRKQKGKIRIFKNIEDLQNYLPAETYEMLLEARRNGKELHGLFTEAALYLSANADAGTTYHEAFHIIFTLALPLETRVKILNEALEKYGDELPLVKFKNKKGEEEVRFPTFIEIEELLADKFMDYVQSKEADKFGDKDFEFTTLGKTFKGLYRMLEVFFNPGRRIDIDQLFEDINLGVYKHSVNFKNTSLPTQIKFRQTDYKYDNGEEERQSFVYMQTRMDDIFNVYRGKNIENELKTEREIISEMGVDMFYTLLLSNIYADARLNMNNSAGPYIMKLYSVLTNKGEAASTVEIDSQVLKQFNRPTDLLERFNHSLVNRGLHMDYKGVRNVENNLLEDDTNPMETNEENTKAEAWMKGSIEMDPKDSMSQRLKSFFATIPKFTSSRKNAKPLVNSFNVQETENANEVFGYLISRISDSTSSVEDMMDKLNALANKKPYINHIINKLNQDPILKSELWLAIGQKHYATFSFAYEKDGEYTIVNSNRKSVENIIRDTLIGEFLVQGNPLFNKDKTGKTNFEDINHEKVDELFEALTAKKLQGTSISNAVDKKETAALFFRTLEEILNKANINISADDIATVWNPESGNASWKNVENLIDTLIKITEELATDKNPFLAMKPDEDIVNKKIKGNKNSIEKLGRLLQPALEREVVSSFRNIEGKTVYNLMLANFLSKQVNKFKNPELLQEYLEEVAGDNLISNLPFLKDLSNDDSDVNGLLEISILDGLSRKGKKRSVSYGDMSDIEMTAVELAMFYNSANKKGVSRFKLPIPSNSTTLPFITSRSYAKEEVITRLVDTARAEFSRIIKLKHSAGTDLALIPNYMERGSKYQILSFLNNTLDTSKGFDEALVTAEVTKFLEGKFLADHIEAYKTKGIIKSVNPTTGEITFADKLISAKVANKTEFFLDYLYNTYYMNTQLTTLLGGDPAFYKNTVNYQKRYKQIMSPGTYTDTTNIADNYGAIILNDEEFPTAKEVVDNIVSILESSNLPKEEIDDLVTMWKTKKHNLTDGATIIGVKRKKQQLEGLQRWTPEHEEAYQREIKALPALPNALNLFSPEKPFIFAQRIVDGTVVPFQGKNSEVTLTRALAYKTDSDGKILFPKLVALYDVLMNGIEDEDGNITEVDAAMFESAVKVGAIGNTTTPKGKVRFSEFLEQKDGTYQLSPGAHVLSLKTEEWRLQQETPEHFIDAEGNFGTQLRNLAIGDMDLEGTYDINGTNMKGYEVAKMYQELIAEDLKASFEELKSVFENEDGTINYERLAEMLRKEVINRDMGQEYLDALEPIKKIIEGKETITTTLPLYHPLISYKMMAVLNSFFKNRVTKQKIAGGAVINASSYGVDKTLKFEVDKKLGKITLEAMMPWTSRKYFPLDANGEVDIEAIKLSAPELLSIIGYRIPTEDKYSAFNIRIVGFTPPNMGGMMMLPKEVTTLAGLDFDIDKMYMMARSFYVNKQGKPKYIKYIDKVETEEQAQELAKNIFSNFQDYKRFVNKNVDAKNINKMLEGRTELLDKLALDPVIMADKEDISKSIKELKEEKKAAIKLHGPDSKFVQYIQDSLDELYVAISDAIPFNETETPLTAKHEEAINFIAKKLLSEDFNAAEFNSSKARDNKKLEILKGIFENKNTALSILNPGNFDSLKEGAARIRLLQAGKKVAGLSKAELVKNAEELDNEEDFNINYPSTQLELFRRNMTGNQLIGIFANHNTHHAKAQYTDLQLKEPIFFNEEQFYLLNQTTNNKGVRISKSLASDLAAVVDTASDPLASFLNMNTFTANTQALLERLGVDNRTIFAFLNQPIILELTQTYFNDKGGLADAKQFREIQASWKKKLEDKLENADIKVEDLLKDLNFSTAELESFIYPSGTLEYYQTQYRAIHAFQKYYNIALELGEGIQAAKADTTGVGPSMATNYTTINKQTKLSRKVKAGSNTIIGLEEVYKTGPRQIMMAAFNKYGLEGAVTVLNKIFPSIGSISEEGVLTYSSLGDLKNWFSDQKGDFFSLTEKEAQMVDINYINFIASGFPFFEYSQGKDILTNLPDSLVKFKKTLPKNSSFIPLLDSLYVVEGDSNSSVRRIEFYTTGKKPLDIQRAKEAWERMLTDKDPAVKEMALKLVQYTFFSAGYGFGPFTFSNMVPVKFWTDSYQIANNIVDTKGRPFNDFLADALSSDFLKNDEARTNRFKKQFMQNHADKEQFTKTVKVDVNKIFTPKAGRTAEQMDYDTTMAARNDKSGIIVTRKGNLIVNKKKNPQLLPFGEKAAPMKYIKVFNKTGGGHMLFEYKETAFDQKNNALYEGQSNIDTVTYFPIPVLGASNFVLEFNFYDDINETSVPKKKKIIAKGPIAQMEAEMDKLTDDAIMMGVEQDAMQDISSLKPTVAPTTQSSTSLPRAETKINIYASTGENAELSNFANRPFLTTGNLKFNTVEGAFQYWKVLFTDGAYTIEEADALLEKLQNATGAEAKKIGRTIKNLNTAKWDAYSSRGMKKLLLESFEQNPDALAKLLATGNATLTHTQDKGKWGTEFPKLLMEVRDELKTTQPAAANKPLSLAQMADTGLTAKQEGTTPATPKPLTLSQMADVNAKEPMGLFEKLESNDFEEYTKAGGTELSKKDFLSLSRQEQANAIYQAKNCKNG